MKKFIEFMEKYFMPAASKIGAQRHLVAIRDGFVGIMPLILAGSFAILLNATLLDWVPFFGFLRGINENVLWGTFSIMTLLVVFSTGYNLAKGYGVDGLAAGLISIGAFIAVTPQAHGDAGGGYIHNSFLSATGLFTGLLVAIIATEIFVKLTKRNLVIKMPDTVPPAVGRAFAAVIPGIASVYALGIVAYIIATVGDTSLYDLIYNTIQAPLLILGQGPISAMIAAMLINLFWFFGLHGANLLEPIMNTVYLPALLENADLVEQGLVATNNITRVFFDAYVHLGGSGATLALIAAIFIGTKKRKEYKEVAKLSLPNGIFQINEPMIFGMPIVLNPILFIPFIITPAVLTLIAYLATVSGLVPPTFVAIPWITPMGIGGFLATGGNIMGGLLALFNFCVAVLIYLPFIKLADKYGQDQYGEDRSKKSTSH
ncbi:PTS system, lactose/cellobiose family IIC subunit [Alkaliphilus metalliredigens QYMF]|uniref:Permease IIC component n=1 Tax=Alkaliphilus metalliredigens (strain QYMF) TaxID=293826 RepID=A6TVQ7_ALKMQ|nr:PTS sugar transporter subunit IIC [Alkaliphilus metalliredigens]ABR50275.1 PTS system, lactose/cellobiose family IIC subunit [Alkaliphilus metalliredigens QYMF]